MLSATETVSVDVVAVAITSGVTTDESEDDKTTPVNVVACSAIVVVVINGEVFEFEPVDIRLFIIDT